MEHAGRTLRATLDGNSPSTLAAYAVTAPVVAFHPEELALSNGPAAGRRRLLDRVALYGTPGVLAASARYTKALRARQELLKRHGNELEIAAYERIVAEQGAALTKFRELAFARLEEPTARAFREIAAPGLELQIRYRQGGSADVQQALQELEGRRARDARAGAASFGPHRDDLTIELCGHAASVVASQGQHRTITLALKAAEAATIFEVTGLPPIRLLDDVSSELDRERTDALFRQLTGARGQVLLTTPRPDLLSVLEAGHKAKRFQVVRGVISEL